MHWNDSTSIAKCSFPEPALYSKEFFGKLLMLFVHVKVEFDHTNTVC